MNSIPKKQISIIFVLVASFLIESPLRTIIHLALSFSQPLVYLVTSIVFHVALFACFIIDLKPNITSKSVIKSIGLVFGFFVLEQIISIFLFSAIIALVYEMIRPLIIFVVILLESRLQSNCKHNFNKLIWIILVSIFVLGAWFNVLEYIRLITVTQNMGNDFFSYLSILTPSNSVYNVAAKLCTYIFTFVLFARRNNAQN